MISVAAGVTWRQTGRWQNATPTGNSHVVRQVFGVVVLKNDTAVVKDVSIIEQVVANCN